MERKQILTEIHRLLDELKGNNRCLTHTHTHTNQHGYIDPTAYEGIKAADRKHEAIERRNEFIELIGHVTSALNLFVHDGYMIEDLRTGIVFKSPNNRK